MNNNYKELNIQKSLYRGCGESFAERLEKMDPTENYRGTELGHLDAFQRQLKRFDIQVGGSHSSALEKFFQNGQSAVLFPEYLMRAIRQGMEENDPLSSIVAARTLISATDYRGLTTNDDLEADVTNEATALSTTTISLKDNAGPAGILHPVPPEAHGAGDGCRPGAAGALYGGPGPELTWKNANFGWRMWCCPSSAWCLWRRPPRRWRPSATASISGGCS